MAPQFELVNPESLAVPLGIATPQTFPDGEVDLDLILRYATRAEELGYHSLWVVEQLVGSTPTPEPVTFLTYLAAVTERIRLGSAVVIATTRNPALLAKQLSTVDVLSRGRLIVGTALGGRPWTYPLFGGPSERRVRHFTESIGVMRALWTQERAEFEGELWQLDGVPMIPLYGLGEDTRQGYVARSDWQTDSWALGRPRPPSSQTTSVPSGKSLIAVGAIPLTSPSLSGSTSQSIPMPTERTIASQSGSARGTGGPRWPLKYQSGEA